MVIISVHYQVVSNDIVGLAASSQGNAITTNAIPQTIADTQVVCSFDSQHARMCMMDRELLEITSLHLTERMGCDAAMSC